MNVLLNDEDNFHIKTLESLNQDIIRTNKLDTSIPSMFLLSAYDYIKNNFDDMKEFDYNKFLRFLEICENNMPEGYICDCSTNFIYPEKEITLKGIGEEDLLKQLVTIARKIAVDEYNLFLFHKKYNYDEIDTENLCERTALRFSDFCEANKIKCKIVEIEAGFDNNYMIFNGSGFHYFNIIRFNNKNYIFDVTYKQFFKIQKNFLQRLGIVDYATPYPGIYMMLDKDRQETALSLLKNGYIEYNEKNLKNYLDGFAMFFRNGLYYEQIGIASYKTDYTFSDYEKFLYTDDSQVKRESKEVLVFQHKPLKDPNFDFSYKK